MKKDDNKLPKEFRDPVYVAKQAESKMRILLKNIEAKKNEKAEDTIHKICERLNQIQNDLPKDDGEKTALLWKVKQEFLQLVILDLKRSEAEAYKTVIFEIPMYLSIVIYNYYHRYIKQTYDLIAHKEFTQSEKHRVQFVELAKKLEGYQADYDNDVIKSKIDPTQNGTLQGILKIYKADYIQDIKYLNSQIINFDVYTEEVKTPRLNIKDKDELAIEAEKNKPPEPGLIKKVIRFLKGKTKKSDKQEEDK